MKGFNLKTAQQVKTAIESIWITLDGGEDFEVLVSAVSGETFESLDHAIHYVREYMKSFNVGLATYEQALMNNAQWDNY